MIEKERKRREREIKRREIGVSETERYLQRKGEKEEERERVE